MNSMIRTLAAVAFSVTAFTSAHAASETAKHADSQYKAAMERCKPMKGNAQDVCEKDAKAARDSAKADDKAARKGTPEARADAGESKARAEYKAAMERCESLKGKEHDACESQAKATLDRRQADADQNRRTN
jgi:hypothetical protein